MSKADYPYADDEFDAPADPGAPRGVHRAPRSAWSRWWPFVAVLVLAPLVAFSLVSYLARDRGGSSDDDRPVATSSAPTSVAPSDEATDDGAETTEPTDEATPTDEPSDEPTAEPDLAAAVVVLNGAGIQGLAGRGAAELQEAGFTSVTSDNFSGTKPAASTVYYASEDLAPTAELVASTLGLSAVTLSAADAGDSITVVLVTDLP